MLSILLATVGNSGSRERPLPTLLQSAETAERLPTQVAFSRIVKAEPPLGTQDIVSFEEEDKCVISV